MKILCRIWGSIFHSGVKSFILAARVEEEENVSLDEGEPSFASTCLTPTRTRTPNQLYSCAMNVPNGFL